MSSQPLRYFEPDELRLTLTAGATHPRVEIRGERTLLSARFMRIFPLSEPVAYVSIQDGAGKEAGILRTLDGLDAEARKIIEGCLDRRYFTPQIVQVKDLRQDAGMWRFDVATKRGDVKFFVRNWRDSAHEVQNDRWMITSVDGQRYEIQDLEALDAKSRNLLEQLA